MSFSSPQKPVGEKLSGPQRLLSDIITWISNFDKGWTKDVLETGSVVCLLTLLQQSLMEKASILLVPCNVHLVFLML
jgi:hypothetical protein